VGDFEYDVFVSYSREDGEVVGGLVERLRRDGYTVWFDETDMPAAGGVGDCLDHALSSCRQAIICLSDDYCRKDYTQYELRLNFQLDPANLRDRTIPVIVRPLTVPVPAEIKIIPWADLTDPASFESQYRRVAASIVSKRPQPSFASAAEIRSLRRLQNADLVLVQMMRYAKELYAFVYGREISGPVPQETTELAAKLKHCRKLPVFVHMHISTIQGYAALIDYRDISLATVEPGLQALSGLSTWASQRYDVKREEEDPFEALWRQLSQEWGHDGAARLPQASYELADGWRRFTAMGAVYRGRNTEDGSPADLLLVPVPRSRAQSFVSEMERCGGGETAPLLVRARGWFEAPEAGEWGFVALGRPEAVTLQVLGERFQPLPQGLALALSAQLLRAYGQVSSASPAVAHCLFRPGNLVVDRSGVVRLRWDWSQQDPEQDGDHPATVRRREGFWFCRTDRASEEAARQGDWAAVRSVVAETLRGSGDLSGAIAQVEAAKSIDEALGVIAQAASVPADDQEILRVAVESCFEGNSLPAWLWPPRAAPAQPPPPAAPPPENLRLRCRILVDCLKAWPLGDDGVVGWQSDGRLVLLRLEDGGTVWCDAKPMRPRVAARSPEGAVAIGSWEGEVRWFADGRLQGSTRLGWTIGDIRAHQGHWLAGSWNGHLQVLGKGGEPAELLPVPDGVFCIAVSGGDDSAALSLGGVVSVYQAGERVAQTTPLRKAADMAFASGVLLVLTDEGLITVGAGGRVGKPDRLPARGALRLVTCPDTESCLLASERGHSWIIDRSETYPRGPWLPRGDVTLETARGFRRCTVASDGGGYGYWRDGARACNWAEALAASISVDGRRIVVTMPGVIEVYEDEA
jgi:hypothetical protein